MKIKLHLQLFELSGTVIVTYRYIWYNLYLMFHNSLFYYTINAISFIKIQCTQIIVFSQKHLQIQVLELDKKVLYQHFYINLGNLAMILVSIFRRSRRNCQSLTL